MIDFLLLHNLFYIETDECCGEYNETRCPVTTKQGAERSIGKTHQKQCTKRVHLDLTNYDERTLAFAKDYSNQLLAIDVNLDTTEMLDVAWSLFGKYFRPEEVNIKKELVDQYWPTN